MGNTGLMLKLEDISDKATGLANMASALHSAMFETANSAEAFGGAMFLFENLMHEYKNDVEALLKALSDINAKEARATA